MRAMIQEFLQRGVTVHRVIATVGDSTFCDMSELREMAAMAAEQRIEVVITVGPHKNWDPGSKEGSSPG
jgi:hypothetical protein